jgi:hypothetical protein
LLVGFGIAPVATTVLRAAGGSPASIAAVTTVGSLGSFTGPPLIGGLASLTGVPIVLAVAASSRHLGAGEVVLQPDDLEQPCERR